jgi:hypothetical protein
MLDNVRVWLIDTPGFNDTDRSDIDVLNEVAYWLGAVYTQCTKLAGILYLHNITENRFVGSTARSLNMFRKLCGTKNLNSVILATTHWFDKEGKPFPEAQGQKRVRNLIETPQYWGRMISDGCRVERHDGSKDSARNFILKLVDQKIRVVLDIQEQLIDRNMGLEDTGAGQVLQSELIAERTKHEKSLEDLKQTWEAALEENDIKWQREIEHDKAEYNKSICKIDQQNKALETNMKKMAEEKEAKIRNLEVMMERDRKLHRREMQETSKQIEAIKEDHRVKEAANQRERQKADQRANQMVV